MNKKDVKIKKLHEEAIVPKYQTEGSAGFDLHALVVEDREDTYNYPPFVPGIDDHIKEPFIKLYKGQQFVVKTGLAVKIPEGFELQIRPRSGLAAKHSVTITNSPGTLDSDYLGEIMVILYNAGESTFIVEHDDRIAQAVLAPVMQANFIEVDDLGTTERGTGGLGSTGS